MPIDIPLLGLGTWGLGGKLERDESNRGESLEALRYGLRLGFRLIDVAEVYGRGLTEEIVGEAIQNVPRQEIFLISKVWKDHLRHSEVIAAAKQSLKRLKTDYIDLYLVHWPSETVPLSETMPAMERLVAEGLVRAIGVSNFSVDQMKEARRYLRTAKLSANEVEYNYAERAAEKEIIPYCDAEDIVFIAHRPLARGQLAREHSALFDELARKYRKTPVQIMLNLLISQGRVAIPKAASREHLEENWGAAGWTMDAADVSLLSG